jgi:crotonobetainyl-CoA:carnitine CoA-transferase CaiB-like acyl-CoA transferase
MTTAHYQPLAGIRVIEISHMIMGPSAGFFLASMGAEVIKIEPPDGDKTRKLTGMGRGFFPTFNRGKKSVVLDTNTEEGLQQLHALLATADVFLENFRDISMEKMGLAPDQLQAKYPKLIIASCKGFLHGPYENRTAMDEVVQMMTGMAYMTGPKGRPLRIGSSTVDITGGLFTAFGVVSALFKRQQDGQGHQIRTGLFESCLLLVMQHMVQFDLEGTESPPMPNREFSWPIYDIFSTADDKSIFIGAITGGHWEIVCRLLGLEQLLSDPRLQTRMEQINSRDWTIPMVAAAVAKRTYAELTPLLEQQGIPFGPVSRPVEMYDDPHVNRPNGLLHSVDGETGQSYRAPGLPLEVDGQALFPDYPDLPAIGEHTAEILGALKT